MGVQLTDRQTDRQLCVLVAGVGQNLTMRKGKKTVWNADL